MFPRNDTLARALANRRRPIPGITYPERPVPGQVPEQLRMPANPERMDMARRAADVTRRHMAARQGAAGQPVSGDGMVITPPPVDRSMVVRPNVQPSTNMGRAPDGTPVVPASTPQYAFDYLTKRGINPNAAAGIVDNLQVESGFSPDVLSGKRRGDSGTAAYGFQWRGDRLRNYEDYAKSQGKSPDDFDSQLEFALAEMDPNSPYADPIASANREAILSPNSRRDGAIAFATHFERPAPQHIAGRPGAANIPNMEGVTAGPDMRNPFAQFPPRPAAPPQARQGPGPQGLFAMQNKKGQTLGDYLSESIGEMAEQPLYPQMPRSNLPRPQNTFVSAQAAPWVTPLGFRG